VVAAALLQITAVEGFGFLFALEILKAGELALLLVVGKLIVASHPGIALLQAADRFRRANVACTKY
jgi:hypothetical protein